MYDSAHDLMVWQRVARREARDLLLRHRRAGPDAALILVPQPGAELLCPACSSEARPDDADTATCGSCGTLSPLDATVSFSNQVHQSLHFGVRVRAALVAGAEETTIPASSTGFANLTTRVGSLIVLGAIAGVRLGQLQETLTEQKPLLQRWLRKELEGGDHGLVDAVPDAATALELVDAVLDHAFPMLTSRFPPNTRRSDGTLGQVFHAVSQYHKFRTSSVYLTMLADGILLNERARLGLTAGHEVPWEELNPLVHALEPSQPAPMDTSQRARIGEEALVDALAAFLSTKRRLMERTTNRHRAVRTILA